MSIFGKISPFKRFFNLILVALIITFSFLTDSNNNSNLRTLDDNISSGLISGTVEPFCQSDILHAQGIISLIAYDDDGSCYFSDIDYENGDRSVWQVALHLTRTERLAILYRQAEDSEVKNTYRTFILKLVDHWIAKDYQNSNWWHNKLSNPNIIGEIGILMKDDFNREQLKQIAEMVGRGCFTIDPTLLYYSGANAIDLAISSIKFGVLTGNSFAIKTGVKIASKELKYSSFEGLKKDGTFFQHGNRLYMGGYGIDFVRGVSKLVGFLSDTDYIFTNEQLIPFANFIVDGLRYMSFGNVLDPTTMGRSVSRVNAQPLSSIVQSLNNLAAVDEMPRRDEIEKYAESIMNNTKSNLGLKFFDESKFLVINNSDFYFSFRGGDNNLLYSKKINDENVLGYNSSFPGVTTIMSNGNEYVNIAPVYDYSFVPGTTAVPETDAQLLAHKDFSYRALRGTYGNTVSDGAAVVFAQTKHEDISMAVSCFATDNAVILLGAGMKDAENRPMNTTIDQSFYAGSFSQNDNTVIHNGIKYTVLDGGAVTAKAEQRLGDWRRNNLTYPSVSSEGDLFTLSVENTGSYAYTVMSENTDVQFVVIENTEKVQAVKLPDGRIAASFIKAGSFSYNGYTYSGKKGEAKIFG